MLFCSPGLHVALNPFVCLRWVAFEVLHLLARLFMFNRTGDLRLIPGTFGRFLGLKGHARRDDADDAGQLLDEKRGVNLPPGFGAEPRGELPFQEKPDSQSPFAIVHQEVIKTYVGSAGDHIILDLVHEHSPPETFFDASGPITSKQQLQSPTVIRNYTRSRYPNDSSGGGCTTTAE